MNVAVAQDAVGVGIGIGLWIWFAVFLWSAPIVIAVARENRNRNQVIIVDLFLGWTGIGWIVALVMAFQAKPEPPQAFYPPPYRPAGRGWPG